ncbi:MAG: adenosylcobinamide-phosphate synthase CbiB [Elainellaceae cyanobacterium]
MPHAPYQITYADNSFHIAFVWVAAALLDYGIGDPWHWLHPVQVMGRAIQRYSEAIFALKLSPRAEQMAGVGLALGLVAGSAAIGWGIHQAASFIHPILTLAADSIMLASCLAGRSLRDAANDVLLPLMQGDLPAARDRLSRYVGRDTAQLSEPEILRAVLETVTENATDGVTAPLFYGLLGMATPLGGMPLALGYKAASTLDSMVGYKSAPYTHLGWCSAKLDDALTWVPCRLTVVTVGLLSGQLRHVLQCCRQDAVRDPSPNAGWSECAYAAALGVQMGGLNYYRGLPKAKPLLGKALSPITQDIIRQALRLTRRSVLLWLAVALGMLITGALITGTLVTDTVGVAKLAG